LIYQVLQTT